MLLLFSGHYHKINKDVEITRLLLILLLNPHPQCNNSEYEKVLHQYTREDDDSWVTGSDALTKLLGEDLSIYMRSLVVRKLIVLLLIFLFLDIAIFLYIYI